MNVGFIGLGIMGLPMAGNLIKGGQKLHVYDVKPVAQSLLDAGAVACASSKEVAQKSEIVITMVPDTPHVAAALFDPSGVAVPLQFDSEHGVLSFIGLIMALVAGVMLSQRKRLVGNAHSRNVAVLVVCLFATTFVDRVACALTGAEVSSALLVDLWIAATTMVAAAIAFGWWMNHIPARSRARCAVSSRTGWQPSRPGSVRRETLKWRSDACPD